MPKHIQEEWLAEAPKPDQRWSEEEKAAFAKIPAEGQELVLERQQALERGYGDKFQALANERKLAEDIRNSVPPQLRAYMEQRGISEAQAAGKLFQLQHQALSDPIGYVRQFISQNKINPLDIIPNDAQPGQNSQPSQQADPRSHPAFQAMAAENAQLKRSIAMEQQQRAEYQNQRASAELQEALSEKDDDGNSRFPFIRLLADPMAQLIESEPDRFGALSVRERFAAAYHQAIEDFPELSALRMTAPKAKADEPEADKADSEERERAAKLERAITPKSRAPQAPHSGNAGAVTLDDALSWASKNAKKR
jgi:hypothetical protein